MIRLNSAIVQLVFMKLSKVTMAMIKDCKLTRKIVFIAKLVISKTHHKILCGSAPRVEAGQITPICEGGFGQPRQNNKARNLVTAASEKPALAVVCWHGSGGKL
jgi:hypothetical protein